MRPLLWDASALTKRYISEIGSNVVIALFAPDLAISMISTFLSYAETSTILRRKFNQRALNFTQFSKARSSLREDVLYNPNFDLLTIDDEAILAGIDLNDRHNLNASDAAILATYLRYVRSQPRDAPVCILVVSDQRFQRAANAEGLATLDPETVSISDIQTLRASF